MLQIKLELSRSPQVTTTLQEKIHHDTIDDFYDFQAKMEVHEEDTLEVQVTKP